MVFGACIPDRSYRKSIRQQQQGGNTINNNISIACMNMIEPATGWFEIIKMPTYDPNDITEGNYYYMDKSSARFRQLFESTWISRYPRPHKVVFDKGSDFKQKCTPLLNYFDIKPVLTTIKNLQYNALVERVHQVILNILVTIDIYNNIFNHIDPWGETQA